MTKLHSLRTRLIALISLLAIAICGALAAFFLPQQSRLVDTALEREMQAQYASVIAAIDYERKSALALSTFASNLPEVQAAFAAGDRDRLVATLGASLKSISAGFGYNLMTMTRPPATVFIRVHQPEVHGDDSSGRRKMVLSVNQEGATQSGIERGLTNLSIFGTVPLMHEGRQLGAFDVGMEFGKAFVETVKARFGVDIAVHVQEGDTYKTLISTLADSSVGTPSELRAGQDGNRLSAAPRSAAIPSPRISAPSRTSRASPSARSRSSRASPTWKRSARRRRRRSSSSPRACSSSPSVSRCSSPSAFRGRSSTSPRP